MTVDKMWCPLSSLSGIKICPQDYSKCSHYRYLYTDRSSGEVIDVCHCELITASMLLNRGNGATSGKGFVPKFADFEKTKQILMEKYFKHLEVSDSV